MALQNTPYIIPLLIAAGVSTLLARYAWHKRPVAGAAPLALFMLAAAEWALGYALEMGSVNLQAKIFWAKMQYFGIVTVAWMMLLLALEYTGHEKWLANKYLGLMAIIPTLTLLLVWTNDTHHWIWTKTNMVTYASATILDLEHGKGFWLIIGYSYACLLLGTGLLFQAYRHAPQIYRAQVGVMLAGTLIPWLGNAMYVFGINPFPHLDLTPFAFVLTGLSATWGLFRHQFLDVVPIARDAVIENMQDGVLVLDKQNRIVDINPAGESMLSFSLREVIGTPATQALSDWQNIVSRYKEAENIQEEIFLGPSATRPWYDLQISALYNRRGQQTGRLVVLRDITDRKRVEEERERLIDELDAFAHTVAHDLKNPLNSISGYVQLLEMQYSSEPEEKARQSMHIIRQGASKMQSIIDALLLLANVRQQAEIPIRPLHMGEIVADAVMRLDTMIQTRQANIMLPQTWHQAAGYRPWIEEIWVNYLSNAIKYGGTSPQIELGSTDEGDDTIRFWIRDNGPGIPADEQAQLFIPFARLNQKIDGHGLGLSIVQRIVERSGGSVAVESDTNKGSTFSFTLPASRN